MLIAVWIFHSLGASAQATSDSKYPGDDLHYLGYIMLTGDTATWQQIKTDDIFYLSKGLFFKEGQRLSFIQNDDLYFLGMALITGKKAELDKIREDDLFYLGSAIFEKASSYLENIKNDDLYYLGKGLLTRDLNYLDQMSTTKQP